MIYCTVCNTNLNSGGGTSSTTDRREEVHLSNDDRIRLKG
jgi:hypothetical protein